MEVIGLYVTDTSAHTLEGEHASEIVRITEEGNRCHHHGDLKKQNRQAFAGKRIQKSCSLCPILYF